MRQLCHCGVSFKSTPDLMAHQQRCPVGTTGPEAPAPTPEQEAEAFASGLGQGHYRDTPEWEWVRAAWLAGHAAGVRRTVLSGQASEPDADLAAIQRLLDEMIARRRAQRGSR